MPGVIIMDAMDKLGLIGLIDVDGHNFPNLALMRISAFYKRGGAHR